MTFQTALQNSLNLVSISLFSKNKTNYPFQPAEILLTVQIIIFLVDFIVMLFVFQLTVFHWWLRCHGLTTFEFITIQREYEEIKENELQKHKYISQSGGTSNLIHSGYTHITGGIKDSAMKHESTNKNVINSEDNNQDFVSEQFIKSKNLILKFKKKSGESTFENFHNLNANKLENDKDKNENNN